MSTISNNSRQFITSWHQRNLRVVDTHDIKRLLQSAAKLTGLLDSFNGRMLVGRATAELARRAALPAPGTLPCRQPEQPPRLVLYDSRAAYNAARP